MVAFDSFIAKVSALNWTRVYADGRRLKDLVCCPLCYKAVCRCCGKDLFPGDLFYMDVCRHCGVDMAPQICRILRLQRDVFYRAIQYACECCGQLITTDIVMVSYDRSGPPFVRHGIRCYRCSNNYGRFAHDMENACPYVSGGTEFRKETVGTCPRVLFWQCSCNGRHEDKIGKHKAVLKFFQGFVRSVKYDRLGYPAVKSISVRSFHVSNDYASERYRDLSFNARDITEWPSYCIAERKELQALRSLCDWLERNTVRIENRPDLYALKIKEDCINLLYNDAVMTVYGASRPRDLKVAGFLKPVSVRIPANLLLQTLSQHRAFFEQVLTKSDFEVLWSDALPSSNDYRTVIKYVTLEEQERLLRIRREEFYASEAGRRELECFYHNHLQGDYQDKKEYEKCEHEGRFTEEIKGAVRGRLRRFLSCSKPKYVNQDQAMDWNDPIWQKRDKKIVLEGTKGVSASEMGVLKH